MVYTQIFQRAEGYYKKKFAIVVSNILLLIQYCYE